MSDSTRDKPPKTAAENPMSDAAMAYFKTGDRSHRRVLDFALDLVPVRSVVDFGTARGGWLRAAKAAGVAEIQGFDIVDTPAEDLVIPPQAFSCTDLGQPLALGRRYDLAISTEVAEHIAFDRAGTFIDNVTSASDFVIFSAAPPYQDGAGHVNELWAEYWAKHFQARGFTCYDILRPRFWHDAAVRSYYRQNLLIFARAKVAGALAAKGLAPTALPLSMIHPEQYLKVIGRALPPEWRRIAEDVTLYYDCVTKAPETLDADPGRHRYGKDSVGWRAILERYGL